MSAESLQPNHNEETFRSQDLKRFQALPGTVRDYLVAGRRRQDQKNTDQENLALCRQQLRLLGEMGPKEITELADYSGWRYDKKFPKPDRQKPMNGVVYEVFSAEKRRV